jgi:hypothetical protein
MIVLNGLQSAFGRRTALLSGKNGTALGLEVAQFSQRVSNHLNPDSTFYGQSDRFQLRGR